MFLKPAYTGLRAKISISIMAGCLIASAIFGAIWYPFEQSRLQHRMDDVTLLLSSVFQQNKEELANEIFSGQHEAMLKTIQAMLSVKGITGVTIYRTDGRLNHTTDSMPLVYLSKTDRMRLDNGPVFRVEDLEAGPVGVYSAAISVIGENVGYLSLNYSLAMIRQESRMTMIFFGILLATMLVTMFLFLNLVLLRFVIQPLRVLRLAMVRVQKGDYGHQVGLAPRDEIGSMAAAFNGMSSQLEEKHSALTEAIRAQDLYALRLQETNEELEQLNAGLEHMVGERTRELMVSNRNLQGEVEERISAEADLAREKERLAVTLRSIGDGVITTDMGGAVVMMNNAAETITGISAKDALVQPVERIFRITRQDGNGGQNPVRQSLKNGALINPVAPTVLLDARGRERLVTYSVAPIRDMDSSVIGAVLVFKDVTEHRRLEEESQKAAKLESLGILAGGIAHDFNNIMTAILGNLSLARLNASADDKIYAKLVEAEKATLHAKGLTRQLLTFSRGGAPIKTTTSVSELIRDTVSFALSGAPVRCSYDIADDLWALNIDASQISQVINNLVINAVQSMPSGGAIYVSAKNRAVGGSDPECGSLSPGRYAVISIRDEGHGIPEDVRDRIFDPYFTTKDKGSGLGLSTSYSIIRNHGGAIRFESGAGAGTVFQVFLPAADGVRAAALAADDTVVRGKGRVLVMDDEENIRDVAEEALTMLGYTVETASDGREAIEKFILAESEGRRFDAVIMDLTIPGGVGGRETIANLKTIDPDVKAVVSSGYSQDPVMSAYRDFGFSGVLPKPFKLEELSRLLKDLIGQN